MSTNKLKYPIGKFEQPHEISSELLINYKLDISNFPERLRKEVQHLSEAQLDTPYREGGWSLRQLVHHCADSHMNSLMRFKLALTEEQPTIKPYFEDRWAELADSKNMPVASALLMLEGLHERWSFLLASLSKEQLQRTFVHPEHGRIFRLDESITIYAWHCKHHLAHITSLKSREGWS